MNDANQPIDLSAVKRGLQDPSLDAQVLFRSIMNAMARPGLIMDLSEAPEPPRGINRATGGIALTLLDFETRVWLDPLLRGGETEAWLRFHCGCTLVSDPISADFAIVVDVANAPSLSQFNEGDAKYPDLSTTVILQVESFGNGPETVLKGPGIRDQVCVSVTGLPEDFWQQISENGQQFQFGVDVFLTSDTSVIGLPRTVRTGGM